MASTCQTVNLVLADNAYVPILMVSPHLIARMISPDWVPYTMRYFVLIGFLITLAELSGCASADRRTASRLVEPTTSDEIVDRRDVQNRQSQIDEISESEGLDQEIRLTALQDEPEQELPNANQDNSDIPSSPSPDGLGENQTKRNQLVVPNDNAELNGADNASLDLSSVIASVHQSFPLLESAYLDIDVANGKQLAAWGAFDTKLKASSENGPTGFYQTYRQNAGVNKPIYSGGEWFAGYRIGRGDFQPWYLERQTNDGGEFKAGFNVPLMRNREIDQRRAELWRATYDQQRVRPEIQAQLILFVRDSSVAYWNWIAAGQKYQISRRALELSVRRNDKLERRVELGDLERPELQDNLRSIAQRKAKLIDVERKLEQTAIKLSLFYRDVGGMPLVPTDSQLVQFPQPSEIEPSQLDMGIQTALSQRPELIAIDALYRRTNVDLAEARNDFLPNVDAQIFGSQDTGEPTSKKRDKSQFELEAGLFVDIPLERRKARGKSLAAYAKLRQIVIKRQFTEDKIVTDVQSTYTALVAAYDRVDQSREARRLAEYMAGVERRKQDVGQSDLLKVFLREQYAIEAANGEVDALLDYFIAQADYALALAIDWPTNPTTE